LRYAFATAVFCLILAAPAAVSARGRHPAPPVIQVTGVVRINPEGSKTKYAVTLVWERQQICKPGEICPGLIESGRTVVAGILRAASYTNRVVWRCPVGGRPYCEIRERFGRERFATFYSVERVEATNGQGATEWTP